ncbi:MAG: NADH:ubiquinone reductase (Na(+)-transporting) subunit C [Bacteroidota bacterium]
MRSTRYIYLFVVAMTVIVAGILAVMTSSLRSIHKQNEAIFNKKAVLAAIETKLGDGVKANKLPDDEVLSIFDQSITQDVVDYNGNPVTADQVEARGYKGGMAEHIDMKREKKKPAEERIFPVFTYDDGGEKTYIISVRGNGLWDEIWGNIALKDDFQTVVGASFDHQGETAGLGAEIKDDPGFARQFQGKKLYDQAGNYTSVVVKKGGVRNPAYEVDGISGATVTGDGVSDMLYEGIKYYLPYFETEKKS